MKLNELDLLEFLPKYMQQDKTAQGIAYALTIELKKIINQIEKVSIYSRIDELDETMLDELAWQFNIPEYISTLDIFQKRALVKGCMKTHRERGTVAAVEKVIEDVFGNGYVEEWFDYDLDKPYHFRVRTGNVSVNDSMVAEFEKIIKSTQNLRSVLDEVIIETSHEMNTYFGGFTHVADYVYFE